MSVERSLLGARLFQLILPGCIDDYTELAVWIWSLMWLIEAGWVLSIRLQTSSASEVQIMKWRIFDLCFVTLYLLGMITFRSTASYFWQPSFPKQSYVLKIAWTYFLIYQCYFTLFIYIPMSNMLGPFMVRVKLMITRDFFYFSILISLVVARWALLLEEWSLSTLVAIKAVVYPDLHPTYQVGANIFGWTWLSLFTTDLSEMKETQECKRFVFLEDHRIQCRAIGGYSNPWCATQGPAATITVYQFLVVLKLISWPILFALFARTAKEVDEEADQIWKYQLYSLAIDFSLRPFLPPPFTFIFFLFALCRRMTGCIADLFGQITRMATDHPDARVAPSVNSLGANSNVYQNPSIPPSRPDVQRAFWGAAAVRHWKQKHPDKSDTSTHSSIDRRLGEKLQLLVITQSFRQSTKQKEQKAWSRVAGEQRLNVDSAARDWTFLLSDYRPREHSVECAKLPVEAQRCVEDNLPELAKHWRNQKLQWHISGDPKSQRLLSADGLPLNPFGRTGLKGRNKYARYGANTLFFYVVFATSEQGKTQVLVNASNGALPSKWKHGGLRPDEYLSDILNRLRVPDADIQRFSTRSHMPVGQTDTNIAHVSMCPLPTPLEDTDNAWTEADLWAVFLNRTHTVKVEEFEWKSIDKLDTLPEGQLEFVQNAAFLFKLQ
ncbi:hypothetical protein M3Y97_00934800 [Aphelenchoides bicaudatus]|nr:hypothetical protein M3Y97_00934800 [Aphelenchoides bicaudatus]